jgi:SPP1 family predicted phage head-tail adaptor
MTVFESLLNNAFAIERRVRTHDGQGGWTITYQAVGTVRGRIRPASVAERDLAQAEQREVSHVLYLVDGADIERGDRVTVTGELTVAVLGIREPSLADHHLEIDCLEIQREVAVRVAGAFWPVRAWPLRAWPSRYWMAA